MSITRFHPSARELGFSMAEVVTIVALCTVVAGVALPYMDLGDARVGLAADELAATLTDARGRAVAGGHDVIVRFDTTAATVFVHLDEDGDGDLDGGEGTFLTGLPQDAYFGLYGTTPMPPGGASVTFAERHGGLPSVTYFADGTASENGVVYLSSGPGSDGQRRAIEVSAATGMTTCHSVRDDAWRLEC